MMLLDAWDVVLLAIAAYVAVLALVRLMAARRKQLSDDLRQQFAAEQARLRQAQDRDQVRGRRQRERELDDEAYQRRESRRRDNDQAA